MLLPNFFCFKLHVAIPVEVINVLFIFWSEIIVGRQSKAFNIYWVSSIFILANMRRLLE